MPKSVILPLRIWQTLTGAERENNRLHRENGELRAELEAVKLQRALLEEEVQELTALLDEVHDYYHRGGLPEEVDE